LKEGFEIIRSSIVKIVIISTTSSKAYWSNNESFSSIKNFDFVFLFNTYIVCENKLITKHNLKKKHHGSILFLLWIHTIFQVQFSFLILYFNHFGARDSFISFFLRQPSLFSRCVPLLLVHGGTLAQWLLLDWK